jgi:CYTH domain-containing protein
MSNPSASSHTPSRVVHPDAPPAKGTKYARWERERRFLLARVPKEAAPVWTSVISDRYIDGTRMRLRRSQETDGADSRIAFKLTQKIPSADGSPGLITTTYLSQEEYEVFFRLPAKSLRKTRLSIPPLGVDIFADRLQGLVLAEAEFDADDDMARFSPPGFCVAEVTSDQRFTGARLAAVSRQELIEALRSFKGTLLTTQNL